MKIPVLSELKKLYKKERARVLAAKRRLTKQGFDTSDINIPKIPKKITEGSVRRLQKMTARQMAEKATTVDLETGEVITARQKQVRSRWKEKEPTPPKYAPAPTPDIEVESPDTLDEYKYLISRVWEEINSIPDRYIQFNPADNSPKRQQKGLNTIKNNIAKAFQAFLNQVPDDPADKENAAEVMRVILADYYISTPIYQSSDIQESKNADYTEFANAIRSDELNQSLTNMESDEFVEAADVWEDMYDF